MFSFLKNLFGGNSTASSDENSAKEESSIDKSTLKVQLTSLKEKLSTLDDNNYTDRISILNELGSICTKLQQTDDAINYYEQSLAIQPSLGKASTDLLKLYNVKRKEAAAAKDDNLIQLYLNKIDNLMKMNKETMKKSSTY